VALLAFGSMLRPALEAAERIDATVDNMRFVKPLDADLVRELALSHDLLVTLEENAVSGGAGTTVAGQLAGQGLAVALLHLGLPDRFVEHGDPAIELKDVGLDTEGILASIRHRLPD